MKFPLSLSEIVFQQNFRDLANDLHLFKAAPYPFQVDRANDPPNSFMLIEGTRSGNLNTRNTRTIFGKFVSPYFIISRLWRGITIPFFSFALWSIGLLMISSRGCAGAAVPEGPGCGSWAVEPLASLLRAWRSGYSASHGTGLFTRNRASSRWMPLVRGMLLRTLCRPRRKGLKFYYPVSAGFERYLPTYVKQVLVNSKVISRAVPV
jgi:hypothetical protein